jgi:tRNA(His) 5'-end guanylyltransferase
MKAYEVSYDFVLPIRCPAIIRIDGKAFHSFTKNLERPFDDRLAEALDAVAVDLLKEIQNSRFAYLQSDEISILLIDYNRFDSQQWLGGRLQRMVSISASIATEGFARHFGPNAHFDSRAFMLPREEIVNYFIWRQWDCVRNSIQMVARQYYSHKELISIDNDAAQEMIFQAGNNWDDYPAYWKRGRIISKEGIDKEIPIFSKCQNYFDKFLTIEQF